MDAKFKSKKHLLYTIFDFFLNQKRYQICWNSFTKMHQRQLVISKTSLTNMSKSGKSASFRHSFAANFLLINFFKTFPMDLKSAHSSHAPAR
jgi:hypothetical protein